MSMLSYTTGRKYEATPRENCKALFSVIEEHFIIQCVYDISNQHHVTCRRGVNRRISPLESNKKPGGPILLADTVSALRDMWIMFLQSGGASVTVSY